VRGARQVGKTHAVRELGKSFENLIEINLEFYPHLAQIFEPDLDPKRIVRDLALELTKPIRPGRTLLFIDEIQASEKAILALRYFHEMMPELHVVAAGSLIDFAIQKTGLPVGRVEVLYMYPMSFLEFLTANGKQILVDEILTHEPATPMPETVHTQLLKLLGEYMLVGGMPEAVQYWANTQDAGNCLKIQGDLINTYRQDFQKYADKFQLKYVELLFDEIPRHLGKLFKFSSLSGGYRSRELSPCLDLLCTAGVVHRVFQSAAQGMPLMAEANLDRFKTVFLDVALAQRALGLKPADWLLRSEQSLANKGGITESLIGQELLAYSSPTAKKGLFYWHRETRGSTAEIDYVDSSGEGQILPIEVKSGKGATLRSLRAFLDTHPQVPHGISFSTRNYSVDGDVHFYPLYAVAKLFSST